MGIAFLQTNAGDTSQGINIVGTVSKMASNKASDIFKLVSGRPQVVIAQKHGETVELEPETFHTMVYITDCTKCEMILKKKPAKVTIEKCQDLVLTLQAGIISGTLEVIHSSNISVNIEEKVQVSIFRF